LEVYKKCQLCFSETIALAYPKGTVENSELCINSKIVFKLQKQIIIQKSGEVCFIKSHTLKAYET